MEESSLCIKCNKTFRDIYELKRHQSKKFPCDRYEKLMENGQIRYKCSYCKKIFSGLQSANYHQNHSCDSAKNTIKKNNNENNIDNNQDIINDKNIS
jgi:DNA-directed RNA polymerase subunit RPC12/RpoP